MNRKPVHFLLYIVAIVGVVVVVVIGGVDGDGDDDIDVHDPDVIALSEDTFDAHIESHELTLVEFYAPWCGHCKALAPKYAEAATKLKEHGVVLAKVDATKNRGVAGRFDVSGYPTLKIFRDGKPVDYEGPREVDGIVSYMKRQVGPAAKPVSSLAELHEWTSGEKDDEKFHVLGVFEAKKYSAIRSSFMFTSNKLRTDFTFLVSTADDVIQKFGEGIHALKVYDDGNVKYEGDTMTKAVEEWIREHATPLVGAYNEDTIETYRKGVLPVAVLYTQVRVDVEKAGGSNAKYTRYIMNRVRPLAERHRGKLKVAVGLISENAADLDDLHLDDRADHVFVVMDVKNGGQRYVMPTTFNKKNLQDFADAFLDGKAERHVKSEPVPATNDGPVTIVTGKTFDSIVNDDSDVMIEFYAPWCGHCRALEPKYEKVGKRMKKYESSVVVAKIDATANEYPQNYEVSGYPTLYFKPSGGGEPIKYEGDRETKPIVKFIKQHANKPIKKRARKATK